MQLKYKRIPRWVPFCPKCGSMLIGNNSAASPYECDCGVWIGHFDNPSDFELINEHKRLSSEIRK